MENLFESIVLLLVGITVMLTSMSMMSSGIKKATGRGLKNLFKKTQNNRFVGLGLGAGVTAIIQSSDATAVMVLGFINAGVMTVFQGVSIMMGAYIGTTATGLLASLSSLTILSFILMAVAIPGIILTFFKNDRLKNIGQILAGFGILFFSLWAIKYAFSSSFIKDPISSVFNKVNNPLLLFVIGVLVAALVQSSSATTTLVITMVSSQVMPIVSALYVVIGATVGTVLNTVLASIGTNTKAKRATFIAVFIKVVSGLLGTLLLWALQKPLGSFFGEKFANPAVGTAVFSLLFNTIFMLIFLPLIKPLEKLAGVVIKDKQQQSLQKYLLHIDNRLLNTPMVAMSELKNEIFNMMELSKTNLVLGYKEIITQKGEFAKEMTEREDGIDFLNKKITDFLIALSPKVSEKEEKIVGSYFHVINDIERIGDHAYNFYESSIKMKDKELKFSPVAVKELDTMYNKVMELYELTGKVFESLSVEDLSRIHELENDTDDMALSLNSSHYDRIQKKACVMELSPFYSTLVSELERIADHLTNIAYSIVNPTGDE